MNYRQLHLSTGWGRPGIPIIGPAGAVIHWTGNTDVGANAINTRNWFENFREYKVSAHLIVDDVNIVEAVPLNEVAYHTGGGASSTPLAKQLFNSSPNRYLLGVEWCVNRDANGAQVYRNVIGTLGYLFARYGWPFDALFRHYDMTTKWCPAFFVGDQYAAQMGFGTSAAEAWVKFQRDVRIAASSAAVVREVQRAVGW